MKRTFIISTVTFVAGFILGLGGSTKTTITSTSTPGKVTSAWEIIPAEGQTVEQARAQIFEQLSKALEKARAQIPND